MVWLSSPEAGWAWLLLTACGGSAAVAQRTGTHTGSPQEIQSESEESDDGDLILVRGQRERAAVIGDIAPEQQLNGGRAGQADRAAACKYRCSTLVLQGRGADPPEAAGARSARAAAPPNMSSRRSSSMPITASGDALTRAGVAAPGYSARSVRRQAICASRRARRSMHASSSSSCRCRR